jgi:hypothetical protein
MTQTVIIRQTITQAVGQRGAQGPAGPAGASSGGALTRTASTAIGGFKVVRELGDGTVALASSNDVAHAAMIVGVTLGAAAQGAATTVVRQGEIIDGTLGLTPGPLFLGLNGGIQSAPPANGVLVWVGLAATSSRAVIDVQPAIIRGGTPPGPSGEGVPMGLLFSLMG